jgi:hypothetical protein
MTRRITGAIAEQGCVAFTKRDPGAAQCPNACAGTHGGVGRDVGWQGIVMPAAGMNMTFPSILSLT